MVAPRVPRQRRKGKVKNQSENGQATVELALLIPILALFLLLIIQVALVVRQHELVANASRAAARELSVSSDTSRAVEAAHRSNPDAQVHIIRPNEPGSYVTVTVRDVVKSNLPFLSVVFPQVTVSSRCTMRVEK